MRQVETNNEFIYPWKLMGLEDEIFPFGERGQAYFQGQTRC